MNLIKSAEATVQDVRNGSPVKYRIELPTSSSRVIKIVHNNRQVCEESLGSYSALVTLSHGFNTGITLTGNYGYDHDFDPQINNRESISSNYHPQPPIYRPQPPIYRPQPPIYSPQPISQRRPPATNQNRYQSQTTKRVPQTRATTTTPKRRESFQCGEGLKPKSTASLIFGGKPAQKYDFPWLVAHFHQSGGFICGGSLVSHKIVVTAAHCIHDKKSPNKITEYQSTYYLGKYKLYDTTERGVIVSGVDKFEVHPDWNYLEDKFTADIAVAILTKNIIFQRNIQPICIHESSHNHNDLNNVQGYVAGWGLTKARKSSEVPLYIKVPVVTDDECVESHEFFSEIKSSTNFCVGDRTGSTPCKGDSGGGFCVKYDNKFYLKGIVSAGLQEEDECSETDYVLFTDVSQYTDWINNYIDLYG